MKKLLVMLASALTFACGAAFAAVDLNTASQQELESVKGIGPAKAKAILDYRTKNGPFKSTEDVMKVPGIKEGIYNKIKSEISVNGKAAAPATTAKSPATPAVPAKPATKASPAAKK